VFWITLALVALAMGVLLALLPDAGSERRWTIHWLPGAGPMGIGLGETGLYATLVTVGACLLALAATRAEITPAAAALTLLALLGGVGALMAEHFLLRYVALEIVALCVALAPLAERMDVDQEAERGRWARLVYLVLRVGDAGLLAGILGLWSATSTLEISPALEAGKALSPATLNWIAGGLLLAAWVKLGGWPVHVWQQAGALLPLFPRTWLYRTLTPSLGFYLLYRITPLLGASALLKSIAVWMGALGAAYAAVLLLATWQAWRENQAAARLDATMVFVGAAQGGLALVLAAAGFKTTVWLALLVLAPLRLLLSLAGDAACRADSARERKAAAALYGLGGLALLALDTLIVWWVRGDGSAGISLIPRLVVEGAVGLIAAWAVVTTLELWRGAAVVGDPGLPAVRRWAALSLLSVGLAAAIVWRAPLLDHLAHASNGPAYALPDVASALRFLVTSPALWIALGLGLWAHRQAGKGSLGWFGRGSDPARAMERGIRQGALHLRAGVEAGILSGALDGIAQSALWVSRLAHRWVEGGILEGTTRQLARTATDSGRLAYRVMEQGGLEGLLRRIVQTVLAGSRLLQRLHTGRLRRNLIWVAASLVLALVALILYVW
jgi:hypothetical protein